MSSANDAGSKSHRGARRAALSLIAAPLISLFLLSSFGVEAEMEFSSRSGIVELNPLSIWSQVIQNKRVSVWLVNFCQPWCPFCKKFAPKFKQVAHILRHRKDIGVAAMDVFKYSYWKHLPTPFVYLYVEGSHVKTFINEWKDDVYYPMDPVNLANEAMAAANRLRSDLNLNSATNRNSASKFGAVRRAPNRFQSTNSIASGAATSSSSTATSSWNRRRVKSPSWRRGFRGAVDGDAYPRRASSQRLRGVGWQRAQRNNWQRNEWQGNNWQKNEWGGAGLGRRQTAESELRRGGRRGLRDAAERGRGRRPQPEPLRIVGRWPRVSHKQKVNHLTNKNDERNYKNSRVRRRGNKTE